MGNITSGSFLDQTFSQGPQQRGLTQSGQFDQTTGLTDYGTQQPFVNTPYNPYLPQQNAVQQAVQANAKQATTATPLQAGMSGDDNYDPAKDINTFKDDFARIEAAKALGLDGVGPMAPLAALLTGENLPQGTYDQLGYMNDGQGGRFDPITGARVGGQPRGIMANIMSAFGYGDDDSGAPNGIVPNEFVNAASAAGLPSQAGNQSIADVINAASYNNNSDDDDPSKDIGSYSVETDVNMSDEDWYI